MEKVNSQVHMNVLQKCSEIKDYFATKRKKDKINLLEMFYEFNVVPTVNYVEKVDDKFVAKVVYNYFDIENKVKTTLEDVVVLNELNTGNEIKELAIKQFLLEDEKQIVKNIVNKLSENEENSEETTINLNDNELQELSSIVKDNTVSDSEKVNKVATLLKDIETGVARISKIEDVPVEVTEYEPQDIPYIALSTEDIEEMKKMQEQNGVSGNTKVNKALELIKDIENGTAKITSIEIPKEENEEETEEVELTETEKELVKEEQEAFVECTKEEQVVEELKEEFGDSRDVELTETEKELVKEEQEAFVECAKEEEIVEELKEEFGYSRDVELTDTEQELIKEEQEAFSECTKEEQVVEDLKEEFGNSRELDIEIQKLNENSIFENNYVDSDNVFYKVDNVEEQTLQEKIKLLTNTPTRNFYISEMLQGLGYTKDLKRENIAEIREILVKEFKRINDVIKNTKRLYELFDMVYNQLEPTDNSMLLKNINSLKVIPSLIALIVVKTTINEIETITQVE